MARRIAPLAAAALVLLWHTLQYNFITDDAFISFVYARNLAEHGALVFNASDLAHPVEGYTNFLWTVLIAGGLLVGISAETGSLVFAALFALGSLAVVFRLAERLTGEDPNPIAGLAPALLAVSASYACWTSGGLETQMFTFFVLTALYFVFADREGEPRLKHAAVFAALAALTRPEGLLVMVCVFVAGRARGWIEARRVLPGRDELIAALCFAALFVPWFVWRWQTYGYPFPNTYYVKAAGAATREYERVMRESGIHYVWTWVTETKALYALPFAVLGAFAHPRRSAAFRFGCLAFAFAALYLGYTVKIGGDFMGLHRFVMPVTVIMLVLAAVGVARLAALVGRGHRDAIALAVAAAVFAAYGASQLALTRKAIDPTNLRADHGIDTPAYLDLYARDRARIGDHMKPCFLPGDFSIFGGVGAKPYRARAEGIDVFGLVSERIAHEVPRTRPRPGHGKWGPDALLAESDPDFVFSCYSLHRDPARPSWNCSPGFWTARGYEIVTLRIPGLRERGEYYTFLAKRDRHFDCAGRVE